MRMHLERRVPRGAHNPNVLVLRTNKLSSYLPLGMYILCKCVGNKVTLL